MPSLRELQSDWRASLLDEGATSLGHAVAGDGLTPEARIAIYRHHVFTTLTAALRGTFPVVCRLVDVRFFGYAAHEFIRRCPPKSPCLSEYGATFADFLADFPPCAHLRYLPDVARLEWALNAALHAEDFVPLDLATLERIGEDQVDRLTFQLDPSFVVLASRWPIDQIWRANQPGALADGVVDLESGGVTLEVRRLGDEVVFRPLTRARYAFRRSLAEGRCLSEAVVAAAAEDQMFDVVTALHELFEENVLSGFRLTCQPKE